VARPAAASYGETAAPTMSYIIAFELPPLQLLPVVVIVGPLKSVDVSPEAA